MAAQKRQESPVNENLLITRKNNSSNVNTATNNNNNINNHNNDNNLNCTVLNQLCTVPIVCGNITKDSENLTPLDTIMESKNSSTKKKLLDHTTKLYHEKPNQNIIENNSILDIDLESSENPTCDCSRTPSTSSFTT
eukprot:Awhi_evm1s9832